MATKVLRSSQRLRTVPPSLRYPSTPPQVSARGKGWMQFWPCCEGQMINLCSGEVASDLRFRAAISEPETPSFCGISGDLAPSTRKSLAIAIVRFWCAKVLLLPKKTGGQIHQKNPHEVHPEACSEKFASDFCRSPCQSENGKGWGHRRGDLKTP